MQLLKLRKLRKHLETMGSLRKFRPCSRYKHIISSSRKYANLTVTSDAQAPTDTGPTSDTQPYAGREMCPDVERERERTCECGRDYGEADIVRGMVFIIVT